MMNPMQIVRQMMMRNNSVTNNPMLSNVINLANQGRFDEVEKIARNLCHEKGVNPDDALSQIKNRFGM